jgi:hypothetical protein
MDLKIVQTILQFLSRVDLKGAESLAFVECIQALNKLLPEVKKPD